MHVNDKKFLFGEGLIYMIMFYVTYN